MARIADFTTATYTGITPTNSNSTGGYVEDNVAALTLIAANTLRRSNKGLLVEPTATNVVWRAQELNVSPWQEWRAGTITGDNVVAPDGNTTAETWASATNPDAERFQDFQAATSSGSTYIFSVWAKAASGTQDFRLKVFNGSTNVYSSVQTATTTWQRFTFTFTGPGPVYSNFSLSNTSGGGVKTVQAWGAQIELASAASSLIITLGASTARSADAVSFTVPATVTQLTFTFDDDSTQAVSSGVTAGASYTIPTNLNRRYIKYIDDNSSGGGATTSLPRFRHRGRLRFFTQRF